MISSSQVYWVMQADEIKTILALFGVFALIGGVSSIMGHHLELFKDGVDVGKKLFLFSFLTFLLCGFTPYSKTIAAMIILPAITSDKVIDTMNPEVKELYILTKDALKNLSQHKECNNKNREE